MSTKKTIQINPELFKISGNKTRKNKEKKELTLNTLVTPNTLKNKLLKRIKEHKTMELKTDTNNKSNIVSNECNDEFNGAMNYLSDLSKYKKLNKETNRVKTLKNYDNKPITPVSLSLPTELLEQPTISSFESYKLNDDVPYGCLKGGKKKTYREWKELTNSNDVTDIIRPPTPPKRNDETNPREERLQQIKMKMRRLQEQETIDKEIKLEQFKKLEKEMSHDLGEIDEIDNKKYENDLDELIKERDNKIKEQEEENKKFFKKTIKRKFTLGKSDKLKQVSVLIKDKQTRKNIINTQKELKKTNITDVRKYLRQHGMIKVGSTCPADILRKTFESALLTGEVNNINKDTLLHNFLSTKQE